MIKQNIMKLMKPMIRKTRDDSDDEDDGKDEDELSSSSESSEEPLPKADAWAGNETEMTWDETRDLESPTMSIEWRKARKR